MKMKIPVLWMLLLMLLFPLACGPDSIDKAPASKGETSQVTSGTDQAILVQGNTAFALALYQALRSNEGNLFYSPFSVSEALAMAYAGARGTTEKQMTSTMSFNLPQDRLHSAFSALDREVASRGQDAKGKEGRGFRLHVINAIWGQKGYDFLPDFLSILSANYGAGLRELDFQGAPDESRLSINKWVSDQTEGKIEDLLKQGTLSPKTRMVLTNAIYFNAAWQNPFQELATRDGSFRLLLGGTVKVPMMAMTEALGYARGSNFDAVQLMYDGEELSMVMLVPEIGQFEAFEKSLSAKKVDDTLKGLQPQKVALTMPKFRIESDFRLGKVLSAMGMPAAFSSGADFSGMTSKPDLFISDVVHKAMVAVDEQGTEAAAATGVIVVGSPPGAPIRVTIDRPFVFLIRDNPTGTILFVGRVVDPSR
ncbi:MAG: serpin family protein [Dehalococcoidia bacterium]|nr:serpin family protein [Dehalococcoidia bacterium]